MKTYKYIKAIAIMATTMATLSSCDYSEDDIIASGIETSYKLPQGDSEGDVAIRQFYANYGVTMLYDFTDKDAYWTPTQWNDGALETETTAGKAGYMVKKATPEYVSKQIKLLNEVWFDLTTDEGKKNLLPSIILLCSEVNNVIGKYVFTPSYHMEFVPMATGAKYNYANIAVNYGSESVLTITDAQKKELQRSIIDEWSNYIAERKAPASDEFLAMVNYNDKSVSGVSKPVDCCAVGILEAGYSSPQTKDWIRYIKMMMMFPESYLTQDPGDINSWSSWTVYDSNISASVFNYDKNFLGILHATKDTKGMVKKRYDYVRQYFIDNYGVDLQAIGNKTLTN